MHVLQLAGIGIIATVLISILRPHSPQFGMLIGIVAGIALLGSVLGSMQGVIHSLSQLANAAQVQQGFLGTILRIIGIAYIIEFAAQIAKDANEGALAGKIELAGKIGIVVLAVPIMTDVVQSLVHLLP